MEVQLMEMNLINERVKHKVSRVISQLPKRQSLFL